MQLVDDFEDFAKPFYNFLSAVQKQGGIPYSHVRFDVWALECIGKGLEESNFYNIRELGRCIGHELCQGVRAFKSAVEVLLAGYVAKKV
jgi:hypothetical protein